MPDKAQWDKNLFHCEFGTSEQQKQQCTMCLPDVQTPVHSSEMTGVSSDMGEYSKTATPSYGGHLYNKKQGPREQETLLLHAAELHVFLGPRGAAPGTRERMQEEVRRYLLHWLQPMESPWKATRNILSDPWNVGQHCWLSLQGGTRSFTGVNCRAALCSFHFKLIFIVNFQFIGFDQIMVIIRLGDIHVKLCYMKATFEHPDMTWLH